METNLQDGSGISGGGGCESRLPPISLLLSSLLDLMLSLGGTRCGRGPDRAPGSSSRLREAGSWWDCLASCRLFWSRLCPLLFVSVA